jgi:hypothetical protein
LSQANQRLFFLVEADNSTWKRLFKQSNFTRSNVIETAFDGKLYILFDSCDLDEIILERCGMTRVLTLNKTSLENFYSGCCSMES